MGGRLRITVLGATGSIGLSTLDVIARHPDRYEVFALTAHSRVDELRVLCLRHRPAYAVITDEQAARSLQQQLDAAGMPTRVLVGVGGLLEVAAHPDFKHEAMKLALADFGNRQRRFGKTSEQVVREAQAEC